MQAFSSTWTLTSNQSEIIRRFLNQQAFCQYAKVGQRFCNILEVRACFWCVYRVTRAVQSVVSCIVAVGALTRCALLHCGDLKAEQMNMQGSTIYQPLRSGRIWHKVNF